MHARTKREKNKCNNKRGRLTEKKENTTQAKRNN